MDPQQEIFTELLLKLRGKGYDVYDGFLPSKNTAYPFFYIADSSQSDILTKNAVIGSVNQTIHVWHNNPRQRGTVSDMLLQAKKICYMIERTGSFKWMVSNITQRIIPDKTTKTPLLHGILEITFDFS